MKKNWYAVYIKPKCEKKIVSLFVKRKIDNYLPLNRIVTIQGNKYKIVHEALFPFLVFVHASEYEIKLIGKDQYIINFMYWLDRPAEFKTEEIEEIRAFTKIYRNITVEKTAICIEGQTKLVIESVFDRNNNLVAVTNSKAKLILPNMGYTLLGELEKPTENKFIQVIQKSILTS
jgi:transcription antitermination factor NusG